MAIAGGAGCIQLRDKTASDEDFLALARELEKLCRKRGVLFLLNDRVGLVKAAGADGVHLGNEDLAPERAREILGSKALIGLSTHSAAEAERAAGRGADYIGIGPIFPTTTKRLRRAPGGTDLFYAAHAVTELPLFPIGGIDAENLPLLTAAGARRAAVCSAICGAPDPRAAAAELKRLLQ